VTKKSQVTKSVQVSSSLWSELVNATIKKVMAPLEVGLTFALIEEADK
jgi:hypothetical protein